MATEKSRKRGHHEGSIYQRRDGRWTAAVTVPGTGKRRYVYGATRREVREQLTKLMADIQRGIPVHADKQTVQEYLDAWLEHSKRGKVRPTTYTRISGIVRNHINPRIGHTRLQALTPQQVEQLLNDARAAGLSSRTVQYLHAVLRNALNQAVRWGLVPRNVASLVRPPQAVHQPIQPWTAEQARQFIATVRDERLEALYVLALTTGLRQGEVLGLRWEDIDLDAGALTVNGQLQKFDRKLHWVPTKTAKSKRTIVIPAVALTSLRAHHDRQRLKTARGQQPKGYVFTTRDGKPLMARNVYRRFLELSAQAGLPRIRFHDLRHTAATLMLAQGVDPRTIMEILGHSQISLTLNTYSHVLDSMKQSAAHRLNALLDDQEAA